MMKFNIIFLILFCLAYKANSFNKLKTYEPRTFEAGAGVNYFDSASNFNSDGNKVNLLSTNKYTLLDSFVQSRYVFPGAWSIFASANVSNAESKNTDFVRTNSVFNMVSIGADYMVYRGFMDIIPEFTFKYSLDPISTTQDTVMTNEGVMEMQAMLRAQNNYSWFSYYAAVGYNYRSERAGLLPWNFGAGVKWGQSFVGAEMNGFQSISDDGDKGTLEAARYSLIQRVNGGSYKFYSVNPSHIQAAVNLDIGFSRAFVLKSFFATSMSGQNYASGMNIGVSLTVLFDALMNKNSYHEPKVKPVEAVKEQVPVKQEEENYRIQTDDGVDQTLFQKEPEVPVASKNNVKSAKPNLSDEELQDQLDQAEMTIKLKSNKKKKKKK